MSELDQRKTYDMNKSIVSKTLKVAIKQLKDQLFNSYIVYSVYEYIIWDKSINH